MVATKTSLEKKTQKNIKTNRKNSKMDPQMGTHFGTHFGNLAHLCYPRQALGAKMTPKAPPRAPGTSPSFDFHRFWVDLGWIL